MPLADNSSSLRLPPVIFEQKKRFPQTFLHRSVAFFSHCQSCHFLHPHFYFSPPVPVSLCHSAVPPLACLEDAISAAFADMDVRKLQVCQQVRGHGWSGGWGEGGGWVVGRNTLSINNSLVHGQRGKSCMSEHPVRRRSIGESSKSWGVGEEKMAVILACHHLGLRSPAVTYVAATAKGER